jgi:hypothetical protein
LGKKLTLALALNALRTNTSCLPWRVGANGVIGRAVSVWLPGPSIWVDLDGRRIAGNSAWGYAAIYPGPIGRWRLRRAVRTALRRAGLEIEGVSA